MAGTRLLLLLSMIAPILFLIAPMAYHYTLVPRAPLPLDAIAELDIAALQGALQAKLERSHTLTLWAPTKPTFALHPSVNIHEAPISLPSATDLDEHLHALVQQAGLGDSFVIFLLCTTDAAAPVVLGAYRHGWTNACQLPVSVQSDVLSVAFPPSSEITPSIRLALKYRWSFSLLNEFPDGNSAAWESHMGNMAMAYVEPLVAKLSALAAFTLESQTLHYASLATAYNYDPATKTHYVTPHDLQQFKSVNDFASVPILHDREQLVHFMAALPSPAHAPLEIRAGKSGVHHSFMIPGYGGVTVLNPRATPRDEVQRAMQVAVAQLRRGLGLPAATGSVQTLAASAVGLADWELDILVRFWLEKHWHTSLTMLTSIAALVEAMPQMTVLPRIQGQVHRALAVVDEMARMLAAPEPWSAATCVARLADVRAAVEAIEGASYDSTMVAQLYFPEEHIYAVYLPLLLPLVLPFGFGLVREVKRLRKKRLAKPTS
ncbi:hypothetical protein ACHHYP_15590 [Achlya hypogyna]|uniref:GPI transamidase component PIG-S n=1 Tax=Achlya hypogyna TaxID=1202772 RepID=A0A1V9YAK7_ACHHY|nr:hypothetical protein ACHHYP_15590 [Achlya hypogyna]